MARSNLRDTILDLAIGVIDEHGEQAIRTNKIAAEAGTTPPTLYHYFGSREGLIEEAQAERFARSITLDVGVLVQRLSTAVSRDDVRQALLELFRQRDTAEREAARFGRVNALGAAFARPTLARRISEINNNLASQAAGALAPFQRQGLIRQDIDLRAVTAWYTSSSIGKALVTLEGSDINVREWERTMNEAVLHVLFGDPPSGA